MLGLCSACAIISHYKDNNWPLNGTLHSILYENSCLCVVKSHKIAIVYLEDILNMYW